MVSRSFECQQHKNPGKGYGELDPREVSAHPWQEFTVDLIGPWKLRINNVKIPFMALTVIDTVTNLVKLVRIISQCSVHVALIFENTWLSRYPLPKYCTYDQGEEFIGFDFQQKLAQHGTTGHPTTSKNPQANASCECMHQTAGNTLRAISTVDPPAGVDHANRMVDTALANCLFATRSAINSAIRASPGSLAFSRDIILDIPTVVDCNYIRQHRQQLVDQGLITANRCRFSHDYNIEDQVLKLSYKPDKLDQCTHGPFPIIIVHTNGMVTIRVGPHTLDCISIGLIKPFQQ